MKTLLRLSLCCLALILLMGTARPQKKTTPTAPLRTEAADAKASAGKARGAIFHDVPEKVDSGAHYLFYLHGRIIEERGIRPTDERYGVYEYEQILEALSREGFIVISEARPRGTDPREYARKVVGQIQTLLRENVPPRNITVVGASKGAVITLLASTALKNREANFVVMANCNDWVMENFEIDLYGRVLSIYDYKDEFGQTCQKFFDKAKGLSSRKEIVVRLGTGHAMLYKPLREWIEPAVEWARGK